MGIRFSCHRCNQPLHVKDYQAGKRGKCPKCQGSFRVPPKDADFSLAVEDSAAIAITAKPTASPTAKPTASPTAKPTAKPLAKSAGQPETPATATATPSLKSSAPEVKPTNPPPSDTPVSMPASLLPLLDARWFVRPPSGGQYGPATTQMLLDWIAEKRVTADSLLWHDGLETWLSARELVPEPFGGQPAAFVQTPPDVPPAAVAKPQSPSVDPAASILPSPPLSGGQAPAVASANKAAIAMKKRKKLKQQWMVLGFLATIALCLVIALIVILTRGS